MHLGIKLYTYFKGFFVGKDKYWNKYYSNKKDPTLENAKRWVIFEGKVEASKVPSHWHSWLHKTTNNPPVNYNHKYKWQKDHIENKTGTSEAYYPSSHPLSKGIKDDNIKKEYEAWKPD